MHILGRPKLLGNCESASTGLDMVRMSRNDATHACELCEQRKNPNPRNRAPLDTGYLMQRVATDTVGPLPETQVGNSYVLVVADYFTRWVEAFPIQNQEATTVAKKLVEEVLCRFSPPEQLH